MGNGGFPEPYADFAHEVMTTMMAAADEPLTTAGDVADAVYRAATDPDCPMMLPAGPDAVAWAAAA